MSNENESRRQLEEIMRKLTELKPRRELVKFLMRNFDSDITTFNKIMVDEWGKRVIGQAYQAGAEWISDLVKVGFATHVGRNFDGLYTLTENGKNFAMDVLVEDEVRLMAILGDEFLSPTSTYDKSTLFSNRGSMAPGTKKVVTDHSEPDGWTAKHIND